MTRAIRAHSPRSLLSTFVVATGIALLAMSCSLLPQRQVDHHQLRHVPARHIAQINFGQEATFAVCTEPVCPTVTPKSFVVVREPAALPVVAIATTPTTGVVIDATTASTDNAPQPDANRTAMEPVTTSTAEQHKVIVQFLSGSAVLTLADKTRLAQSLPTACKADRIDIYGRTDSIGADTPNQSLALARAFSVREYLRQLAPTLPAVMVIKARGRCCFIASNDTPQGRSQNRRVEIVFHVPEQVTP